MAGFIKQIENSGLMPELDGVITQYTRAGVDTNEVSGRVKKSLEFGGLKGRQIVVEISKLDRELKTRPGFYRALSLVVNKAVIPPAKEPTLSTESPKVQTALDFSSAPATSKSFHLPTTTTDKAKKPILSKYRRMYSTMMNQLSTVDELAELAGWDVNKTIKWLEDYSYRVEKSGNTYKFSRGWKEGDRWNDSSTENALRELGLIQ